MYKTHEKCTKHKEAQSVTHVHWPTSWDALSIKTISHAFSKSKGRLLIDEQVSWLATRSSYNEMSIIQILKIWKYENVIRIKNPFSLFSVKTFYAPEIEDRGACCFCPVCHSVILSETLTSLITFEQWMLELWYFTCVFLVIRPFRIPLFFYPVTLTLEFNSFFWKL